MAKLWVTPEKGKKLLAHTSNEKMPGLEYPAFSLRHVVSDYCITNCTPEESAQFVNKVRMITQLPWQQIHSTQRHGLGCEKISRDAIKKPIPAHITADVSMLAFRCFGKAPMIGYKDQGVFYVLWFDPRFELYDH
jgi:hypothetical protein